MKILFISSGNSSFGIVPFIKSQGESIRRFGINIEYFSVKGQGFWGYLKNISILKNKIKQEKFDLIHAHYALCGWISYLSSIGTNTPVIVSYMGCDVYGDVNLKGKRTLSSYINIIPAKLLPLFVNKIIVKSKNLYNQIIFKNKATIIPNGVNFNVFKPANKKLIRNELNLPNNKKLILFLGNPNDPRKNILLIKKAIKYLNNPDIVLLSPYPISPDDVPKYLNAADVLILSSFLEGSPNVIKEAMACNLPIVATDVGDVREIIENTGGCYISSYDPLDVVDKLEKALSINKRTNGRKKIKNLDSNVIGKRIIQIYADVLKPSKKKTNGHDHI